MGNIASLLLYCGTYLCSAIFLVRSKKQKKMSDGFYLFLAIFVPLCLAAFRDRVGTDFNNYLYIFRECDAQSLVEWFRQNRGFSGHRLGVWVISNIAGIFQSQEVYLGMFAFCAVYPVFVYLKKEYAKEVLFLCSFIYLMSTFTTGLNTMKQVAAIGILFYGIKYVYEQNLWKWCLIIVLACCFHITALCAVPIYFLYGKQVVALKLKNIVMYVGAILVLANIQKILEFIGGRFATYIFYEGEASNNMFYLNLFWVFVFLLLRSRLVRLDPRNELLISMMIVGSILEFSGFTSPIIKRVAMFYNFPQCLLLAQIPLLFKKSDRNIVKGAIFIYAVLIFIVQFVMLKHANIIPYNFGGDM